MEGTLEDNFTDLLGGFMRRWAFVGAMRIAVQHGLLNASEALHETYSIISPELLVGPRYHILPDMTPETFESSGIRKQICSTLASLTIDQAMAGAEAASLIFAHTILDDLAISILRFLVDAEPEHWEKKVCDRKITLDDSKQRSFTDLRDMLLGEYVAQLSKEKSLPKRIGIVFAESSATPKLINDFSYDQTRMEKLDDLRHSFIHKDALGTQIPNVDDDLDFIHRSGMAMLAAVSLHLSVKASPLRMMQVPMK